MASAIRAIGTANPIYKRHQQETVDLVAAGLHLKPSEKRRLKALYNATGIEYRHSVLSDYNKEPGQFEVFPNHPDEPFPTTAKRMLIFKNNALPLAQKAIENCLSTLPNYDKKSITHLITVSCTGMYAPGIDIELIQTLPLNSTVKRTAINFMGCYGTFNALKVAHAICKADPEANVMIVSIELCTIHFQNNKNLDNLISNAIFADGAAAALISNHKTSKSLSLNAFHCDLLPQTNREMAWNISDSGFDIVLSSYVPQIIETGIASFTKTLLAAYPSSTIDLYAIHPGGTKILQACEKALNIRPEDNKHAYQVLRDYGNMSSATILFVLKAILDDLKKEDHQKNLFSCAFGPGLTLESMLLSVHHP